MKKMNLWKIPTVLTAILAVILAIAIPVTTFYETMINAALGAETQKIIAGENDQIFYWTEYESEEDLTANDMAVCRQVEAEGAVLLVNKDNALPLASDTKFSLFSQSVVDPVLRFHVHWRHSQPVQRFGKQLRSWMCQPGALEILCDLRL